MSKLNQIQNAIRQLDGGAYQKMMDEYLYKRFGFDNITPLGSHTGTDKTTKGTPDSYVRNQSGKFILIAYGSTEEAPSAKIEKDILSCLDETKTGVCVQDIEQIICCHTSTNISVGQQKQLYSHFENTIIIGMGDISFELSLKYPSIAKDHLGVGIDTHQIFDKDDFLKYISRNIFATPLDMPLLCREVEADELLELLNTQSVVLICGRSGIGKTKLALETAEIFANTYGYALKVLKSNNEPIYDDLQTTFIDEKDYIVVIDDADQLIQVKHLVDMVHSNGRMHRTKILMTVRDYAKDSLLKSLVDYAQPVIYPLKPLNDENIKKVLCDNLDIKNEDYLQQILKIAKGNMRLAIMAGKCAIDGSFENIRNTFDIFSYYFSGFIDSMNKKEIVIATLIALFDSLILTTEEKPIEIAKMHNISIAEFADICQILHNKEIVSIYKNLAVKFEDQNLRDYLIYYTFFKTKWLTPSDIIKNAFPKYRKRIVYAFNTIISLFYTEENINYLNFEVSKAWAFFKDKSSSFSMQFIEAFHANIPDETLLFIKNYIDNLPEIHTDFSGYDFEKTKNNHSIQSEIIGVLIDFKYSKHYQDAIDLALYYLEKNTEYPMDFYFLFNEEFGFCKDSYKYHFAQEKELLDRLLKYYVETLTAEAALCLMFYVSYCLKFRFEETVANPNGVVFYFFSLPCKKEVCEIRKSCFEALSILFLDEKYRHFVIKVLLNYPSYIENESNKQLIIKDLVSFSSFFSEFIDLDDFDHCLVLNHFLEICERYRIECSELLLSVRKNKSFILYLSIKKDRTLLYRGLEEAELIRKREIFKLVFKTSNDEFANLWSAILNCKYDKHNDWDIAVGINYIFDALAYFPERYLIVLSSYFTQNTPICGYCYKRIVSNLIKLYGYEEALKFLDSKQIENKMAWIMEAYDNIPQSQINDQTPSILLELLSKQINEDMIYILSYSTTLRINKLYPGFAYEYIVLLSNLLDKNAWIISSFLSHIEISENTKINEFIEIFRGKVKVLENTYIVALKGKRFFDFHGGLLIGIAKIDPLFLQIVIKELLEDHILSDNIELINVIWMQDNYTTFADIIADTLIDFSKEEIFFGYKYSPIFSYKHGDISIQNNQEKWLLEYIEKYYSDLVRMKFMFSIVCNFSETRRKKLILLFCSFNKSFSDFKCIHLFPTFASWSGSEIPEFERKILFLNELMNELIGFAYIEHRAYLSEYIQCIQNQKDETLLEEFIEEQ